MSSSREWIHRVWNFLSVPGSMGAAIRAPRRSLTSIAVVGRLFNSGVRPVQVVDVGAHTGQFAGAVLAFYPNAGVDCLEPQPELVRKLQATFRNHHGVRIVQTGVGSVNATRRLRLNYRSHSSSFLPLGEAHRRAFPHATEEGFLDVSVSTLDSLLETGVIRKPDLIKIDVQGFEGEVLRGAARCLETAHWVLLETGVRPLYEGEPPFREIDDLLDSLGYSLDGVLDTLPDPRTGVVLQMDVLYSRHPGTPPRDDTA